MFKKIMVPVDLGHLGQLEKSLDVAADLAGRYDAPVIYVAVISALPSQQARTPTEFEAKLNDFAKSQSEKHGHTASAKTYVSHDPAVDLNDQLLEAIDENAADLVVMASHIPKLSDHLWPSHGGRVATRAHVSVLIVR
ncbi:universal stress protein [Qingshengfaniella alkalisoli]|uniref:Universal stress protein n=1 Tax=Qingshengfaniella alkalisoli TaxID=2599296 RepID=A0A5B8I7W8_9RHOB|nr:universal stress protein [Qingshengfaniella alkalisoli]QDY68646.1 universal stress protein [Qingshengfaniella alkalisoli]